MIAYKTPGVYTEEISTLPPSVAAVDTAIPAFIGYTEKAERANGDSLEGTAVRITSMMEYVQYFGGPPMQAIEVEVGPNKQNTNEEDPPATKNIQVQILKAKVTTPSDLRMYFALQMYFANGGGPGYIVSVGAYGAAVDKDELEEGLAVVQKVDEVTLLLFPDVGALTVGNYYNLYASALAQCGELKDRFVIIDTRQAVAADTTPADVLRDSLSSDYLLYGAAYHPWLWTGLNYHYDETSITLQQANDTLDINGNLIETLEAGELDTINVEDMNTTDKNNLFLANLAAIVKTLPVLMPPSSAMAGIYARVDRDRGVFKAPANVAVSNVLGLTETINNAEQEGLNVHSSGKSINAIRSFTGKGTLVWGARTLDGNSNEWRYISVRRLFNFIEESISKAMERFVFEPNNENTWIKVKGTIESFLTDQWQAGALAGSTPQQAFFVNIGLGVSMTAQDILEGRLVADIGIAAVRPAEFIILRFSHKLQEA